MRIHGARRGRRDKEANGRTRGRAAREAGANGGDEMSFSSHRRLIFCFTNLEMSGSGDTGSYRLTANQVVSSNPGSLWFETPPPCCDVEA